MQDQIKGPLTLERQLASFQDVDPIYQHLYTTWKIAKADLPEILKNIILSFPHYSLHDSSHSETIVHRIEAILGEERIAKLRPTEIWLFLMSAYTHDLGMLLREEETRRLWKTDEFTDYLREISDEKENSDLKEYADIILGKDNFTNMPSDWSVSVQWAVTILTADYIRRQHPKRSGKVIENKVTTSLFFDFDFSFNHFIHKRFIELIGKIAVLHGGSFDNIFSLNYCCQGMGLADDLVYPRRIAAMLRLGDLLDMDNGRFDVNVFHLNGVVPQKTIAHQQKEASLYHFLVNQNCIEASFDCPTEASFEAASSWMNWLKKETENLALKWNKIVPEDFGSAPLLQVSDITLKGKKLKENKIQHFNFSNDAIFELLEGANIYQDKFSCLRELVQNAEDATKLRFWEDLQSGEIELENVDKDKLNNLTPFDIPIKLLEKYKIHIEFSYDTDKNQYLISVSDRGVGISESQLKQMEQLGESWHELQTNKKEYKNMPGWLRPTGAFGIGIQSVFQLADILYCETVPRREDAKKITFRSRKKGAHISVESLNDSYTRAQGTRFYFYIKANEIEKLKNLRRKNDPFEVVPKELIIKENLYYLLNRARQDIGKGVFFINYILKYKDKKISQNIASMYQIQINENWKTDSNEENKSKMIYNLQENKFIFYNGNKNCIMYNFMFALRSIFPIQTRFKGMRIKFNELNNYLNLPYRSMVWGVIDINGLPTRDYLTLNRKNIRQENLAGLIEIIQKDFCYIIDFALRKIIEYSFSKTNSNIFSKRNWLSLLSLSQMIVLENPIEESNKELKEFDEHVKYFRELLYECLNEEKDVIKVVKVDENHRLLQTTIPLKQFLYEILEKHSKFWVYNLFNNVGKGLFINDVESFSKKYHLTLEKTYFISCQHIKTLFSIDSFKVHDITKDDSGNKICLVEMRTNPSDFAVPSFPDEYKREFLITSCYGTFGGRMVLYAMKSYKDLAISEIPESLIEHKHGPLYDQYQIPFGKLPYMITPFNTEDLSLIENKIAPEEYWENIKGREDFHNLVEYVLNKNINPHVTKDQIYEAYHQWILDFVQEYQKLNSKNE